MILFFTCGAVWFYEHLSDVEGECSFYYEEECVTREQLENFWQTEGKKKIQDIVFYRIEKNAACLNTDFNRMMEGEVQKVAGNMELLTRMKLCEGGSVTPYDEKGCVISKELSYQLFGTVHSVGEKVTLSDGEEKTTAYFVRGILDTEDVLCMVQGEEKIMYPYVRVKAKGTPLSVVKQELAAMFPMETSWYSEGDFYIGIGRIFLYFPLWVILLGLFAIIKKRLKQWEKPCLREISSTLCYLVEIVGITGLLFLSLRFSDDYIPTAWSDFDFFTTLFREKADMMFQLLRNQWHLADMEMFVNLSGVIVCSVLTILSLRICYRIWKDASCHPENM